jgi:hypothetical protein
MFLKPNINNMTGRYNNCVKNVEFTFTFPMRTRDNLYRLKVPLEIPYSDEITELVQRLVTSFKLPAYIEDGE